jgi:hypothetical protein
MGISFLIYSFFIYVKFSRNLNRQYNNGTMYKYSARRKQVFGNCTCVDPEGKEREERAVGPLFSYV